MVDGVRDKKVGIDKNERMNERKWTMTTGMKVKVGLWIKDKITFKIEFREQGKGNTNYIFRVEKKKKKRKHEKKDRDKRGKKNQKSNIRK